MNKHFAAALNLVAPAKLNLNLHVTGKRADGYHLLESIFTLIDLVDHIDIISTNDGQIVRKGDIIGDPTQDLCVRAASLLKKTLGNPSLGCEIHVRKQIPTGAGLGGGSSDAATTLIALNQLWHAQQSMHNLMILGEKLGADVPFFIFGRSAFVQGIGEHLTPIDIPAADYLVVWPDTELSTKEVFSKLDLTKASKSVKITFFSDFLKSNWPHLPGRNDLQWVAQQLSPTIDHAIESMKAFNLEPRMTGSGSSIFAIIDTDFDFEAYKASIPHSWKCFSIRGLKQHPLKDWF